MYYTRSILTENKLNTILQYNPEPELYCTPETELVYNFSFYFTTFSMNSIKIIPYNGKQRNEIFDSCKLSIKNNLKV